MGIVGVSGLTWKLKGICIFLVYPPHPSIVPTFITLYLSICMFLGIPVADYARVLFMWMKIAQKFVANWTANDMAKSVGLANFLLSGFIFSVNAYGKVNLIV